MADIVMELIETRSFTRQVEATLTADEYWVLQLHLMGRPDAGMVIPGTGGLRKLRWRLPGRGKRGGARIIYYWDSPDARIYLLYLYQKNVRGDLSRTKLQMLRAQID